MLCRKPYGGEPLFLRNIIKIIKELDKREIKIEGIFTNGTLLTEEIVDRIEKIQQIPFFISLNGPMIELHEKFMGKEEVFKKIVENIKMLKRKRIKVYINTSLTVFVKNKKLIKNFYELVKKLGVYRWRLSRPFPQGNWKENEKKFGISLREELKILGYIFELWRQDNFPFDLELGHILRYIDGEVRLMDYKMNDYVCDYYRERITILPNGDVSFCPILIRPPFVIGNLRKQSLKEIWESKKMRHFKDLRIKDVAKKSCYSCSAFRECGLGCRAFAFFTKGNYKEIDPEACATFLSPDYQKLKEKIYREIKAGREILEY